MILKLNNNNNNFPVCVHECLCNRTIYIHQRIIPDLQRISSRLLPRLLYRIEMKRMLPDSFYKAILPSYQKQIKKKNSNKKESCRPISLINIDAKILSKILSH